MIGKKFRPRNDLSGFVLEYHTKKQTIHNIVLLSSKGYEIFTIDDTNEQLKAFATDLGNHLPLLDTYTQSLWDKFSRKIKL
jgi:hypothetical protein